LLYFYILLWLSLKSRLIFARHYFIVFALGFFYTLRLPFRLLPACFSRV